MQDSSTVKKLQDSGSLGERAMFGAAWALVSTVATKLITFVSQLLLARLLLPDDFGRFAFALSISGAISILAVPGLPTVLTQRGRKAAKWVSALHHISVRMGVLSAVLLGTIAVAYLMVGRDRATPVLLGLLAITSLATNFGSAPGALLNARFQYRTLTLIATLGLWTNALASVLLAWWDFGVLSFALPMPFSAAITSALKWRAVNKLCEHRQRTGQSTSLYSRAAYVLLSDLLNWISASGDYFLLGFFLPADELGFFYFAFNLSAQSVRLSVGMIAGAIATSLSHLRSDRRRFYSAAHRSLNAASLVGVPLCCGLAAISSPLVDLVYGGKWRAAVPLVQILSIGFMFDVSAYIGGSVLTSLGAFRTILWIRVAGSVTFVVAVSIGITMGTFGVAIAEAVYYATFAAVFVGMAWREHPSGPWLAFRAAFLPVPIAVASFLMAWFFAESVGSSPLLKIAIIVATGSIVYVALVSFFLRKSSQVLFAEFRSMVCARRKGTQP